jgi:cytidyltransferase-like protein
MVADVLHAGHILAIKEAKAHCDYLIVALYCKPKRKPNIVQSIFERYVQLSAIKYVDEVVPYEDEEDTIRILLSLQYDVYFLGADYKNKSFEGKEILKNLNKEIYYLSRNHTMSSTKLKEDIRGTSSGERSKVIAVDFDGCICTMKWPDVGEPNWDVIQALQEEKRKGSKLILWSCRCGDLLQAALDACDKWGLQFDAVNENLPERLVEYGYSESRKISADEYWDDLAVVKK